MERATCRISEKDLYAQNTLLREVIAEKDKEKVFGITALEGNLKKERSSVKIFQNTRNLYRPKDRFNIDTFAADLMWRSIAA